MILESSRIAINGVIWDISEAGCLFRPKLRYLLQRSHMDVEVVVNEQRFHGQIKNTNPRGYGILFTPSSSPNRVERLLAGSE